MALFMIKSITRLFFFLSLFFTTAYATECQIQPPIGWQILDTKTLPTEIKLFVRNPDFKDLPASINIATEETSLTLTEYLAAIEESYEDQPSQRFQWAGKITTDSGIIHLCQSEAPFPGGRARILQGVLVKDNVAYVITATASITEFAKNYKNFYNSFKSFKILP